MKTETAKRPRWVYFIEDPSNGLIKIGVSYNPLLRIENIGKGLNMLAVIPGDRSMEAELHRRFKPLREHGEWFRPKNPCWATSRRD